MLDLVWTDQVFLAFTYNDECRLEMFMSRAGRGKTSLGGEF